MPAPEIYAEIVSATLGAFGNNDPERARLQLAEAKSAAISVIQSGAAGSDHFAVSFTGHANDGSDHSAADFLNINVYSRSNPVPHE